jgi:hypothetical protein
MVVTKAFQYHALGNNSNPPEDNETCPSNMKKHFPEVLQPFQKGNRTVIPTVGPAGKSFLQ